MANSPVPDKPLPLARDARLAVLGCADEFTSALLDALSMFGRPAGHLTPKTVAEASEPIKDTVDVVFVAVAWESLESLLSKLADPLADVVVATCATSLAADQDGFFMQHVPHGSVTATVARALPRSRVVGVLQQFTANQIMLATLGAFESDVPVVGDDREATDLVEGLIDQLRGFESVYAGGLEEAAGVEGLSAILNEMARERGRPVGFRLHEGGRLEILD